MKLGRSFSETLRGYLSKMNDSKSRRSSPPSSRGACNHLHHRNSNTEDDDEEEDDGRIRMCDSSTSSHDLSTYVWHTEGLGMTTTTEGVRTTTTTARRGGNDDGNASYSRSSPRKRHKCSKRKKTNSSARADIGSPNTDAKALEKSSGSIKCYCGTMSCGTSTYDLSAYVWGTAGTEDEEEADYRSFLPKNAHAHVDDFDWSTKVMDGYFAASAVQNDLNTTYNGVFCARDGGDGPLIAAANGGLVATSGQAGNPTGIFSHLKTIVHTGVNCSAVQNATSCDFTEKKRTVGSSSKIGPRKKMKQ